MGVGKFTIKIYIEIIVCFGCQNYAPGINWLYGFTEYIYLSFIFEKQDLITPEKSFCRQKAKHNKSYDFFKK
jgi:hypothetical protein